MIARPTLRGCYHLEVVPGEGAFLLSDAGPVRLEGTVFERLVPYLDGQHTADAIAATLAPAIDPAKTYYALTLLAQRGYIEDAAPGFAPIEAAYWGAQGIARAELARRRATATVSIAAVDGLATAPLAALLEAEHVRVADDGDLPVVLAGDYLSAALAAHNQDALRSGRPWLLARPVGAQLWLGPVFRPGHTGCWECLAQRLRSHREIELVIERSLGRSERFPVPRGATTASRAMGDAMIATAIAQWVARGALPDLEGTVCSFDLRTWRATTHRLVRQPYCPACGEPDALANVPLEPLVLEHRPKTFTADGGHRAASPEETLERYGHLISPITGLVADLQRCEVDPEGLVHVYIAGDNRAVQRWTSDVLKVHFRSKSAGKGVTCAQARASGLCEALERFSGYHRGYERCRRARFSALGDAAVDPRACMQYSAAQYRDRDRWNARRSRFNLVPSPFDDDEELDWSPAWSLTHARERWLPTSLLYYAYPSPGRVVCIADSNGAAAGNTLEEAVLQGVLELIERDALGIWWYNRAARPAVALDDFGDPYPGRLKALLARCERTLWVLDLTHDLGIPVFGAFSRRLGRGPERIIMGFGAHLDARIALLRAVTELNQMLSWVLPSEDERRAPDPIQDPETLRWLRDATLTNQPYLVPDERLGVRRARDFRAQSTSDLRADVGVCTAAIERCGIEVIVLDQTRPDIGLPVVKVIAPGLRHCHARFAPGRLYEVPVALGWRAAPCPEDQLNPIPVFL